MKVTDVIEKQKYVKQVIENYSSCIISSASSPLVPNVSPSKFSVDFNTAKDVALCLQWLESILDSAVDSSEILSVNLKDTMFDKYVK